MLAVRNVLMLSLVLFAKTPLALAEEQIRDPRDPLPYEMGLIAEQIKEKIPGEKSISIREPAYTSDYKTATGGIAMTKYLRDALVKRANLTIDPKAPVTVSGTFDLVKDRSKLNFKINTVLRDKADNPIGEIKKSVGVSTDFVAKIFNAPAGDMFARFPALKDPQQRLEAVVAAVVDDVKSPKTFIKGSKVSAAANSKYLVEILVENKLNELKEVDPKDKDGSGMPYVAMKPDDIYKVKIYNNSDREIAAQVCIDGLSMFAYQEGGKKFNFVIIKGNSHFTVPGWYATQKKSYAFKVRETDASQAPSDLNKSLGELSTITVAFHLCWEGDQGPKDEPATAALETTRGNPIDFPYEKQERKIGEMREAVSIRYEREK